jgi:hypothetical protein
LTPPGPPGVSKEAKFSSESEFGGLVRYNWAKNPESLKNRRKPFIFWCFFVISEIFRSLFNFGWIVAHQTTKFRLSGWFCFFRYPWGSWGRQSSGLKQKLANTVTVLLSYINSYKWSCNWLELVIIMIFYSVYVAILVFNFLKHLLSYINSYKWSCNWLELVKIMILVENLEIWL